MRAIPHRSWLLASGSPGRVLAVHRRLRAPSEPRRSSSRLLPSEFPADLVCEVPDGALLSVRVSPRAGRSEIAGVRHGALLVRLAAAPVDGAANQALVALIAEQLQIPRTSVTVLRGAKARTKRLLITGIAVPVLSARLAALLSHP